MSHGSAKFTIVAPRSKFYQGPFGRICGDLPPWSPNGVPPQRMERFFLKLANDKMVELPGKTPTEIAHDRALINDLEEKFSSNIPAGYTYFGQFVDHDITFDPASSLMRQNDPNGLLNHRTPRLDLDNVYGRGPGASPHLYDEKDPDLPPGRAPEKFLIDKVPGTNLPDLPRNSNGRALIGDPRNDENAMVSQLQLAFLLAHNTLVDRARAAGVDAPFEAARTTLRWLYQHIVWNDYIVRITIDAVQKCALSLKKTCDGRNQWKLQLTDVYKWRNNPFMPVEFSVAAYRFGHSMVRNAYQTNFPHRGFNVFAPIFDNSPGSPPDPDDLRGFRPMKAANYIQWDWFLKMESSRGPFPQMARKIDTKLANALAALHEDEAGSSMNVLAFRNLLRGWRFELPSGTDVARKLGIKPIKIAQRNDSLWFYILREAERQGGKRLGRVGSTIVCATFAGLLKGDPNSYLNIDPNWKPNDDPLLQNGVDNIDDPSWQLSSIIRLSGLPVSAGDFAAFN